LGADLLWGRELAASVQSIGARAELWRPVSAPVSHEEARQPVLLRREQMAPREQLA
jgi:hypothetical protein